MNLLNSHHSAPVRVLERASLTGADVPKLLAEMLECQDTGITVVDLETLQQRLSERHGGETERAGKIVAESCAVTSPRSSPRR